MQKRVYVFFNKYHDTFRVRATSLASATSKLPDNFFYEWYELSNSVYTGTAESH